VTGPAFWVTAAFMMVCAVMGYSSAKKDRVALTVFWMTGWAIAGLHTVLA
jgi:hypothetical protein